MSGSSHRLNQFQSLKELIESRNDSNIPLFMGFVEDGEIVLRDPTGVEFTGDIIDYITNTDIDLGYYNLLKAIQVYDDLGLDLPPDIIKELNEYEDRK